MTQDVKSTTITPQEEAEARGRLGGRYHKYPALRATGMAHAEALAEAVKP